MSDESPARVSPRRGETGTKKKKRKKKGVRRLTDTLPTLNICQEMEKHTIGLPIDASSSTSSRSPGIPIALPRGLGKCQERA